MKTIEVTDEMYDFLINLSKELNNQDHRCTAMPYFFQIQTNEEIAVPEGNGNEAWYNDGIKLEGEDEINDYIAEYQDKPIEEIIYKEDWEKEEILENAGWYKVYYDYEHRYQNAFFTEKACKEHIRLNHYHYNEPVDYLSHAFRNPELEMVLKFICKLTNGKLHT